MKAPSVTWKDIQIFVKDRGALVVAFVLPLIFILVFSYAFSALGSEEEVLTLHVVNLDPNGEAAQALVAGLDREAGVETELVAEGEAQPLLEEGEIERVLVIPQGFSNDVTAGQQVTLRLVNGSDASESQTEAIRLVIDGVAKDLSLQAQLIAGFQQMGDMMMGAPEESRVFTTERIVAQARSQFERAQTAPLVAVTKTVPDAILREREEFSPVGLTVPGSTVLFVFLMSGTTALSIFTEKKEGTFRRLMAAPMSRAELLGGKLLPNFITVLVQIVVIFATSVFLLPLVGLEALSLGNDPLALIVLSLLVALCSTSLGVLIVAIARTEGQISGLSNVALWIMGAVSGAFVPQFFLGDLLSTVGKVTPHYWAINAYTGLLVRGQTLADITMELAILAAFTVVFLGIGLWKFKFD